MFTEKAQVLIDLAKDCAFARAKEELDIDSLLAVIGSDAEAGVRLAECLTNGDVSDLRSRCPDLGQPAPCPGKLDLSEQFRGLLAAASDLASAEGVPDRHHPGLIDLLHLVCAVARSRDACRILGGVTPISREDAVRILTAWYEETASFVSIADLVSKLRGLRAELLTRVFGQDHAVHAFVEGLYNAEVTAAADRDRKRPSAVFVFAGPPGVGKTYLAELCSSYLGRPFRRFDMTGYTSHESGDQLVGFASTYRGAQPGTLTKFVEQNPNAFLLFDEIEKAHLNTIQLFYQILDAGRLQDKFTEKDVSFRDTVIIFTTNAGSSLYDNPNQSGISAANSSYHRRTILSALENEKNPTTGQPAFPPAICSRLAQGYPVMFNHLGINELERVSGAELARTEALLEKQYFKRFTHDPLLPLSLVLREGGRVDARQLRAETEKFAKSELFKFASLYTKDKLDDVFDEIDAIRYLVERDTESFTPEVRALYENPDKPRMLLIANSRFSDACVTHVPEIRWLTASSADECVDILTSEDVDIVLLDIWIRRALEPEGDSGVQSVKGLMDTVDQGQDYVPLSARALDEGRNILRKVHERFPWTPIYLLSFTPRTDYPLAPSAPGAMDSMMQTVSIDVGRAHDLGVGVGEPERRPIDDELFLACVRAGGARGLVVTDFIGAVGHDWQRHRDLFAESLQETALRLYREKRARTLAQERKVLVFDTVSDLNREDRRLTVRLRDFRQSRAVEAADAGEMVSDVQRPTTRFEDVIGADAAKEELKFFIDYLKDPRRFLALGLTPPKGVLLYGPPGTGKTMLARAMAGESNVAFIQAAASSFVTMWQGSGPQNVRDLFARARRYAPAIIFIDEIDTIGKVRTGTPGAGQAEENTLNALLAEIDGFVSPSPDRPVFVLAATNFRLEAEDKNSPERSARTLDPALVRRFSRTILVDLPERAARERYLSMRLRDRKNCAVSADAIKGIAERSTGMSIANLESIIEAAARAAVKTESELTDQLLEEAFETVRFGEARSKDPEQVRKTACHEAGHTILYWLSGWWPSYVTIVSRGEHGGYMAPCSEEREKRASRTRDELLASIRVSLGGRAAELTYYGREGGLSTGAYQDLENATHDARLMVCRYGMDEEFGLLVTPELYPPQHEGALSSPVYLKVNELAGKILKEEIDKTLKLLEENREHLDAVVGALAAKERVTSEELKQILPPVAGKGKE